MAKNQIIGRVIAVSDKQVITNQQTGKQTEKRQLYIDCTRYDSLTGEKGYENTPLLEFTHKGLEKLEELVCKGLKKGDIVTISFDVQGNKWTNADNKMQIITSIRPYDIELTRPTQNDGQQQAQQAGQQAAPAPAPAGQQADGQQVDYSQYQGDDALPF